MVFFSVCQEQEAVPAVVKTRALHRLVRSESHCPRDALDMLRLEARLDDIEARARAVCVEHGQDPTQEEKDEQVTLCSRVLPSVPGYR